MNFLPAASRITNENFDASLTFIPRRLIRHRDYGNFISASRHCSHASGLIARHAGSTVTFRITFVLVSSLARHGLAFSPLARASTPRFYYFVRVYCSRPLLIDACAKAPSRTHATLPPSRIRTPPPEVTTSEYDDALSAFIFAVIQPHQSSFHFSMRHSDYLKLTLRHFTASPGLRLSRLCRLISLRFLLLMIRAALHSCFDITQMTMIDIVDFALCPTMTT